MKLLKRSNDSFKCDFCGGYFINEFRTRCKGLQFCEHCWNTKQSYYHGKLISRVFIKKRGI